MAPVLDPTTRAFYCRVLTLLTESSVPHLLGGAYAFACYTGIERHTKDLDIFIRERDLERAIAVLEAAGLRGERTHPHWLAKVYGDDAFVDLIFNSANGLVAVDDEWFAHSVPSTALDLPVKLCPAEETIWSKSFVLERERCDVADVAHLLRGRAAAMDWPRLLRRFGPHWRVLLAHLILFGFIYPDEVGTVPAGVLNELLGRVTRERSGASQQEPEQAQAQGQRTPAPLCRGTLLSWSQYLPDLNEWGYRDARLLPTGTLSPDEIARWTAAEK